MPTGAVINVFEAVDVIQLIKGGVYEELNMSVGEALLKRSDVSSFIHISQVLHVIELSLK